MLSVTALVKRTAWHLAGWFIPGLQTLWANLVISRKFNDAVDQLGRFNDDFISCWESHLKTYSKAGVVSDQIYEHEATRRDAIAGKAQSSLNSVALVVAAISLGLSLIGRESNVLTVVPAWVFLLGAAYFVMAFWLAFRAVHVHRYIAVEYDELKNLVEGGAGSADADRVLRGVRARRLAAVVRNRQQTLCVSNLVEGSFLSLRNGLAVFMVATTWAWFSPMLGVTEHTVERSAGEDGVLDQREVQEHWRRAVPRRRYREIWPVE